MLRILALVELGNRLTGGILRSLNVLLEYKKMGHLVKIILLYNDVDVVDKIIPIIKKINIFEEINLLDKHSFIFPMNTEGYYDIIYIPTEYSFSAIFSLIVNKLMNKLRYERVILIFQSLPLLLSNSNIRRLYNKLSYSNILRFALARYGLSALSKRFIGELLPYFPLVKKFYNIMQRKKYTILSVGIGLHKQLREHGILSTPIYPPIGVDIHNVPVKEYVERSIDILFAGGDRIEKGVLDFLYVLKISKDILTKNRLKIALCGKISKNSFILDIIKNLKRSGINIEVLGEINHQYFVKNVLCNSKILIFPSYGEGVPLTILEALACGVRVILYRLEYYEDLKIFRSIVPVKPFSRKELARAMLDSIQYGLNDDLNNDIRIVRSIFTWHNVALSELELIKSNLARN